MKKNKAKRFDRVEGKTGSSGGSMLTGLRLVRTHHNITGFSGPATAANLCMAVFCDAVIPSEKKSSAGSNREPKRIFEISINF